MQSALRPLVYRFAVLAVPALLLSCGDDPAGPPDDDGLPDPITLAVTLDAAAAAPGGRLVVSGIPNDVHGVYARVTLPGGSRAGEVGVGFLDRSGPADELIVPLHPTSPMDGGSVELEFTNGSNVTSNLIPLDLGALTPAPGAFAAVIDGLQLLFDGWLAQNGTTRDDLRATSPELLPALDLPLLITHSVLDHPGNPNTLRDFADGAIPMFDEADVDREVLDALTALSGLDEFLSLKSAFVDTLTAVGPGPYYPSQDFASAGPLRFCIDAPTFGIGPNDCGKLAEVMVYRSELAREADSAAQQVIDDLENIVFTALGYTRAAAVAAGIASTFWAIDNIEGGHRGTYPSRFVNEATDFQLDPTIFPEDFTEPGLWDNFLVTAESDGWRFDDVILKAISKIKGARSAFDQDTIDGLLADAATGQGVKDAQDAMTGYARNAVVTEIREALGLDEYSTLEYCPQTWADIDCTGLPYSSSESPELDTNDTALTFQPTDVGTAHLTISTTSVFGSASTGETKVIRTNAIEVSIDPFQASADTDESVGFTVRVANAINPDVRWWTEGSDPGGFSSTVSTATVITPGSPWGPPIEVHARSLANTGLREGKVDSDPRDDMAPVTYGSGLVYVDPPSVCVMPNETQQFTATLIPGDIESVTWRVEPPGAGFVDAAGLYTAPSASRTDPVAIIATVNGSVEGSALVNVGECACNWTAFVSGAVGDIRGGLLAWISFNQLSFHDEDGAVFVALPFATVTGVGSYDVILSYFRDSAGDIWSSGDGEEIPFPVLTVAERDGNESIRGQITGTLIQVGGKGEVQQIDVLLDFHAQWADLGEALCGE